MTRTGLSEYPSSEMEFSKELRQTSRENHSLATKTVYLTSTIALSSPKVYRIILSNFYWVYRTIEEELETRRHNHPKLNAIYIPEVLRTKLFEKDLVHYYGEHYEEQIQHLTPMTKEYVTRLKQDVEEDPIRLIAYCHTMHVGILVGGQVVKGWIERAFGNGVNIFDFGSKEKVKRVRTNYTEALNCISLTREERDKIIEQKKRVFLLNDQLFKELQQNYAYRNRLRMFYIKALIVAVIVIIGLYLVIVRKRN